MGISKRLETVLLAILSWPIPIANGLIVGALSSREESIQRSIMLAIITSFIASAFYYSIDIFIKLPILTPIVLSVISVIGVVFAVYFTIYAKLNYEEVVMTPHGITSRYYVRRLKEVKYHVRSLGFKCSRPKFHIKDENHVVIYFDCGDTRLVADVVKEWKYLKVVMKTV